MSKIKAVIFTDLHAKYFTLIDKVFASAEDFDVCFTLGDIDLDQLKYIKSKSGDKSVYGIAGNHDPLSIIDQSGINNLHRSIIDINNIIFAGFSGSHRYKDDSLDYAMFTHEQSKKAMQEMEKCDILISHDAPYDFYGMKNTPAHCGLKGISKYAKKKKCKAIIHGHYHDNIDKAYKINLFQSISVKCFYKAAIITIIKDKNGIQIEVDQNF